MEHELSSRCADAASVYVGCQGSNGGHGGRARKSWNWINTRKLIGQPCGYGGVCADLVRGQPPVSVRRRSTNDVRLRHGVTARTYPQQFVATAALTQERATFVDGMIGAALLSQLQAHHQI
jgi:hypothetical protein